MKPRILLFSLSLLVLLFVAWPVQADDPIVGEIRIFSGTTPPDGWVLADGRLLGTTMYAALYNVIGDTYYVSGSNPDDGFYVPDLRGRIPVGKSSDAEFDALGERGGEKSHTLTVAEMPSHSHTQNAHSHTIFGSSYAPLTGAGRLLQASSGNSNVSSDSTTAVNQNTGGDGAHNNLQPYITLNYIIFTGVYQNPTPTPTPTSTPIPGGATGPLTGTITGSLVISQALPSYAFTQTLTTGNEIVYFRSASYGEIIAGSGALLLLFGVIFWFVARSTRRRSSGD